MKLANKESFVMFYYYFSDTGTDGPEVCASTDDLFHELRGLGTCQALLTHTQDVQQTEARWCIMRVYATREAIKIRMKGIDFETST